MIDFEKYKLNNGLTVILQPDTTTPIAAVNICYNVGSRDENPQKTGFAHLFEHLMFGGSKNIPDYDMQLQKVGGENNAFTNTDITNYYLTIPIENLETALWLESDRMNELAFSSKSLEVQRNVVIEEFNQSYLNQPYGDLMLLLKPLAYKVHPYQWNTIGKTPEHIKNATMEDVKNFFYTFYRPNNAVLSISGNLDIDKCKTMINKWFSPIKIGNTYHRNLPQEPIQNEARYLEIKRHVPCPCICKAYKMGKRTDNDFYATDLLSDILSNGDSARLPKALINDNPLFSSINVEVLGSFDNGLLLILGYLNPNVDIKKADKAIENQIDILCQKTISETELTKVKNKVKTILDFAELSVQDKALNLSIFEIMSRAEDINDEEYKYTSISPSVLQDIAQKVFNPNNCSTIYYNPID